MQIQRTLQVTQINIFHLSFKDVSSKLVSNGVKKLDKIVANSMTADYFMDLVQLKSNETFY